jgi:putative SOS response-associated peptidase YedK
LSGEICPIIVSAQHFNEFASPSERLIIPALWGLVPRWHKGDFREHGFNTVNFQVENIDDSRMYKPAFNRGKRCVLICEGFYEWQRIPTRLPVPERSVYFIHKTQSKGVNIGDKSTWTCDNVKLMHIAGIFDIWHDEDENPLYSFTILSKASNDILSWLHPRMPVILETQQQISNWLNFSQVSSEKALKVISNPKHLEFYKVSAKCVLNGTKKGEACKRAIEENEEEMKATNSGKGKF